MLWVVEARVEEDEERTEWIERRAVRSEEEGIARVWKEGRGNELVVRICGLVEFEGGKVKERKREKVEG